MVNFDEFESEKGGLKESGRRMKRKGKSRSKPVTTAWAESPRAMVFTTGYPW